MATLKKPRRKPRKSLYDYHEVSHYLERFHRKDFRNYAGCKYTGKPNDKPYLDFWHWSLERRDVHNGCEYYLPGIHYLEDDETPAWVKEILTYFYDFLGHDFDEPMWLWW